MLVLSVTPQHFGPFPVATRITIQQDVTVFTGQNDVGKSCALSAIAMFCNRTRATESHVNIDRFGDHVGSWNADLEVSISVELLVTAESIEQNAIRGSIKEGDVVTCVCPLNDPAQTRVTRVIRGGTSISIDNVVIKKFPRVVQFQPGAEIRSTIELARTSSAEQQFLALAFGERFTSEAITSLSAHRRIIQIGNAEEVLNEKLVDFFPRAVPLKFKLADMDGGKALGVSLIDGAGGYAPLDLRGSGVRRMLTLMGLLLANVRPNEYSLVLLDEPDTSLHADAQHQLRRVLEALASSKFTQVIYVTHSPSMINPAHPERVRVFFRERVSNVARSKVSLLSYGENFQLARISLGLNPSDSLLYGLVTILVEGDTESRCMAALLRYLCDNRVPGFERIASLLESCHFVCGHGDSISYYCKLAVEQNARPVVFLDGDKGRLAAKIRDEYPSVPVVELPQGTEFEQIVPANRFIEAVSEDMRKHGIDSSMLTLESFEAWQAEGKPPARMMFSKKIERWIFSAVGCTFNKHAVMDAAIRVTPIDEIETASLLPLVEAIESRFAN